MAGHDGDPPRRRWLRLPVPSLLTGVMIAALTAGGLAAYAMITGRC
ncbi:hypothetical protein ACWT_8137 [Actinoplanes sp. SE50]|nr:hypothetical protein ACPL_8268 [Actinoplanes sp. SE50/110]ATO87552.1 hypothetical protein ACWT_8137 [Actinoplanes sp. SE50]SLM04970.1 hypothetical protein ACSP50_8285 [Actinoplanes sp. SE50/110]